MPVCRGLQNPEGEIPTTMKPITPPIAQSEKLLADLNAAGVQSIRHGLALLSIVKSPKPPTLTSLASRIKISSAGITGMTDRLEKLGLVEREMRIEDRRLVYLIPTDKAKALFTPEPQRNIKK